MTNSSEIENQPDPDEDDDPFAGRLCALLEAPDTPVLSLAEFFRESWHVLEPSVPLTWNWHLDAICDHVEAALVDWYAVLRWQARATREGFDPESDPRPVQRIKDQIINVPPGTAKSRIVSVCTPAWVWTWSPSWRAIFFSGNPTVSIRDSMLCRDLIRSDWYQETFKPAWKLARDQDAKTYYKNTAGGFRAAKGVRAKVTGDRADAVFFDDPNDAAEIESDAERDTVNTWYDQGAGNRVNDLQTSTRTGIMQRLHEEDWTGHVLPLGDWFHLPIPMEYEQERQCECKSCVAGKNPIGWVDPRSEPGELMMPARFPAEILSSELLRLGSAGYAGQYQQTPASKDGDIFKGEWFANNRYRVLPKLVEVWTTWDTALKDKQQNDETSCVTSGLGEDGDVYVIRAAHGRWETPDVAKFLIAQAYYYRRMFGDAYKGDYVEDKVSGTTLMQYVKRHIDPDRTRAEDGNKLAVIPIPVEGDKVARARGVSPLCEAKRVHLPDTHIFPNSFEWVRDLLHQLTHFPRAKHDDMVDAFVYSLKRWLGTIGKKKSRRGRGTGGQA